MICIVTQHFSLNRIILLLVGLWPYQRSKLVQLQIILCLCILISSIVYQFAVFLSADCTIELVLKVLSTALFCLMFVIEYNACRINNHTMKRSLEQLQDVCNDLQDEIEIDIMKKYGENGKRFSSRIILFHTFNLLSVVLLPFMIYILDDAYMNEFHLSHVIQIILPKHFVGRENYFYLVFLYMAVATFIGGTALVATLITCIAYIKHICGMFRIASYRIEKAIIVNTLNNINLKDDIIMYREIIQAVDIHRKAIKFTTLFFSGYELSRFILVIIAVLTLSVNLYGISAITSLEDNGQDFVMHFLIVGAVFVYLFFLNYAGQEFTDHNNHIFFTVYNVQWYLTPFHIQKVILFLLQRGSKTVNLNFGTLFTLSLEFFATLTKASISYFTVVRSM